MADCEHEDFTAHVDVVRLTKVDGGEMDSMTLTVRVECVGCGQRLRFIPPFDVGDLAREATVSVDRCELRVPVAPENEPDGWGLDRPGFRMRGDFDPGRNN